MKAGESNSGKKKPYGNWDTLLWIMAAFAVFFLIPREHQMEVISWQTFAHEMLEKGDVERVVVTNREDVTVYIRAEARMSGYHAEINENNEGPHYRFKIGSVDIFEERMETLIESGDLTVAPEIRYEVSRDWISSVFNWLLPLILFVGIWIFILRRVGGGLPGAKKGEGIFSFTKSKAKRFDEAKGARIRFDDIAGLDEAKAEVIEIVDFLKRPEEYTRLGAKLPRGVLLVGPPGTGKTMLAKAIAGESGIPFYSISGSEFVEMFVGVGASRVRSLFEKAKASAPSIIFIDEIDAVGRSRRNAMAINTNDERESTLNQLLSEMDGFGVDSRIIVIAATNRPEVLDKALLRPGRFDRHIYLELPTRSEREAIFRVHTQKLVLAEDIDIQQIASQTPGFSGADIANVCNEAALSAAREHKDYVHQEDFSKAIDRIVGGLERKSKIISSKERRTIAFHEAGHAVTSWFLKHADDLIKVSIVPRGKSLGAAWYQPEEHHLHTKAQLLEKMCVALGGRASEEINLGEVSSGALDDLEKVTKLAYSMVAHFGFSEKLGKTSFFNSNPDEGLSLVRPYSESTAQMIDQEVREMVEKSYQRTYKILTDHRDQLNAVANLLLENEVIYRSDIERILGPRRWESGGSADLHTEESSPTSSMARIVEEL